MVLCCGVGIACTNPVQAPLNPVQARLQTLSAVQGRCREPPPDNLLPDPDDDSTHPMLPLRDNQCLLLLNSGLFDSDSRIWLDGLYLRVERDDPNAPNAHVFHMEHMGHVHMRPAATGMPSMLWLTEMTVQGDASSAVQTGHSLSWALFGVNTRVLAESARPCTAVHACHTCMLYMHAIHAC